MRIFDEADWTPEQQAYLDKIEEKPVFYKSGRVFHFRTCIQHRNLFAELWPAKQELTDHSKESAIARRVMRRITQETKMKESIFQARIIKEARAVGAVVLNVHGGSLQSNGWPDLQINHPWWNGFLELKNEHGKVTPLQAKRIKDLLGVGTWAFVARPGLNPNHVVFEDHEGNVICHNGDCEHWLKALQQYCERFSAAEK